MTVLHKFHVFLFCVPEKRHSSPVPSRSPMVPMKPKAPVVAPAVAPSPVDTLAFRVPKDYPHSRFTKAPLAVYPPKGARSKTWWEKSFFCCCCCCWVFCLIYPQNRALSLDTVCAPLSSSRQCIASGCELRKDALPQPSRLGVARAPQAGVSDSPGLPALLREADQRPRQQQRRRRRPVHASIVPRQAAQPGALAA